MGGGRVCRGKAGNREQANPFALINFIVGVGMGIICNVGEMLDSHPCDKNKCVAKDGAPGTACVMAKI